MERGDRDSMSEPNDTAFFWLLMVLMVVTVIMAWMALDWLMGP